MFLVKEDRGFAVYFDCNTQAYTVLKDGKFLIGNKFKFIERTAYEQNQLIDMIKA